jgi:hypothetical protein
LLINSRDGVGEPKRPPCVSCHHSGSNCVLAGSSRGGNFRFYKLNRGSGNSSAVTRSHDCPSEGPEQVTTPLSHESADQTYDDGRNGDLDVQLRNPSDALHILAHTDGPDQPELQPHFSTSAQSETISPSRSDDDRGPHEARHKELPTGDSAESALGEYFLIKEGQLGQKQVLELLSR